MSRAAFVRAAMLAALLATLTGCATAVTEDDRFGAAEVTFHVLNAVDQAQSINAISHDCYREVNQLTTSLIGDKPSSGQYVAYGVAISLAFNLFNRLEWVQDRPALRAVVDALAIGAKGWQVAHNENIGMRPFGNNTACSP